MMDLINNPSEYKPFWVAFFIVLILSVLSRSGGFPDWIINSIVWGVIVQAIYKFITDRAEKDNRENDTKSN